MYFDPISAWLVALIADSVVIAGEKCKDDKVDKIFKESGKAAVASMNAYIKNIREKGYLDAEDALKKIKQQIEYTKNSLHVRDGSVPLVLDIEALDSIIELYREAMKDCWVEHGRLTEYYRERVSKGSKNEEVEYLKKEIDKAQKKAQSYSATLKKVYELRKTQEEREAELARQRAASDSNGMIILKSILVIGLCIGAFALLMMGAELLGAAALIGAAIGGYYILK